LALLTGRAAQQFLLNVDRWELLPLPPAPEGWADLLQLRWDRSAGFFDESDPLPRDPQYRRSYEISQGTAYYFHYVSDDVSRALLLYWFGPERRVLRIVDLPESWQRTGN
jgi:hypothetical protein